MRQLKQHEFEDSTSVGRLRDSDRAADGSRNRRGDFDTPEKAASNAAMSVAAEMFIAVNPFVKIDRGRVPNKKIDDAGPFQVRSTEHPNGHLLIYDDDPSNRIFILVTGKHPNFKMAGWILCRRAKLRRFWRTDMKEECFCVPQSFLNHDEDSLLMMAFEFKESGECVEVHAY